MFSDTLQADLNWENPEVRAELKKVCEFWADRG
ncbi:alpha-amylase family glycosyl hydrolase, partial [Enterobacter kobei]